MEIELKLALDSRHLQRLKRHPLLADSRPQARKLHSIYFDTPDFALMRRGVALRLRRVGYHWVQTVKAEAAAVGALTSRPEWEVQVADNTPDFGVLPDEARALFADLDPTLIAPAFITEFKRQAWLVERGGSAMEVALDAGAIRGGAPGQPLVEQPLCELEIELKSGPAVALFDLALNLLSAAPLRVEPRSKAARGYALAGAFQPAPVKAIRPELADAMPAGQAWAAIVQAALTQASANVPGFLAQPEEIEYLHQMRVGLRRLRAAAGLRKSLGLARPAWDTALRDLMHTLNPARDWDVFIAETLPGLQAAFAADPIDEALLAQVQQAAARARRKALDAVASPVFTRLVLEMGRDLLTLPDTELVAREWAAHVLGGRWEDLRKQARKMDRLGPGGLHEMRIAAKRLRYAADAFEALYGKRVRKFIGHLSALQDDLGLANDVAVSSGLLRGLGLKQPVMAFDCGRLVGLMLAAAQTHGANAGQQWQALVRLPHFWR